MRDGEPPSRLRIEPLDVSLGLRQQACEAIKRAIMDMDIYGHHEEIRLAFPEQTIAYPINVISGTDSQ